MKVSYAPRGHLHMACTLSQCVSLKQWVQLHHDFIIDNLINLLVRVNKSNKSTDLQHRSAINCWTKKQHSIFTSRHNSHTLTAWLALIMTLWFLTKFKCLLYSIWFIQLFILFHTNLILIVVVVIVELAKVNKNRSQVNK